MSSLGDFIPSGATQEADAYDRCAEDLSALLASRSPGSGWQEIASAPKDGTRLLLARKQVMSGELTVVSGHWNSGGAMHMPHWSTCANIHDWTHWMPLPDPPSVAPRQEQEQEKDLTRAESPDVKR